VKIIFDLKDSKRVKINDKRLKKLENRIKNIKMQNTFLFSSECLEISGGRMSLPYRPVWCTQYVIDPARFMQKNEAN